MSRPEAGATSRIVATFALLALAGCAPTLDVLGVYFPGWLVSSVIGVVASYGIVLVLGRREATRAMAASGLLFVALVAGIALATWLLFFSGF